MAHSNPSVTAVILAAGKGTRMKSNRPKVLFPVLGTPLVSQVKDAVAAAGVEDAVVVVGHGRAEVEAALAARHPGVRTALQAEQKGTGHAVMVALPAVPATSTGVLVVCGDTPRLDPTAIKALIDAWAARGAKAAMWVTTLADPTGYGRVLLDEQGRVARIVEQKDATAAERQVTRTNPGVYVFDKAFLEVTLPTLRADNAAGEIYLTDVIAAAARSEQGVVAIDVDATMTLGINDREQLADAERAARATRNRALRMAGVTVDDSAIVDHDVVVGLDCEIGPGVHLRGKTVLGAGCRIGQGCVVTDCVFDDDVTLHPYSVCDQARVGRSALVGPFARLRPEADVGEGAHVGNYVELKKTKLGKGSKANHLAYLGDAVIGAGVNVGAGTITCNYDGIGKHQTTLHDGVFVGSNSTLVAPLVVGRDAYIAAGSVVTDAVPDDAVAFGRARQQNKEGYARTVRDNNATRAGKKPRT